MKRITPARLTIALLLLVCGGMFNIIMRQRDTIDRSVQYGASDKHNNLASAALALDDARRNIPDLNSDYGKQLSPEKLSAELEHAVADLEKVQIHLEAYETVRRRSGEPPIILFDRMVFQEYKTALYPIIGRLGQQNAASAADRAVLAGIDYDLGALYQVTFDHVILVQEAAGQQGGRLNDQLLPSLAESMQRIAPTLKLNSVRQKLDLFPSIASQENSGFGANSLFLALRAPTTCAEVGQPITFTLELEHLGPGQPPIALQSLEIAIRGNTQEEHWSAITGADGLTLDYGDTRRYEWIWTASEEFRDTTVLVEARATQPTTDPQPTPDPDRGPQDNPTIVDLKLGIGALTQTWEERMGARSPASVYEAPPRTLPCAQMVR